MPSKKKLISTVWQNSLAKSKSNLHQENMKEKQNYVMPLHLLKTYIRNPEIETKLLLCSSNSFVTKPMRRGYARAERRDAKLLLMSSCFAKLLEANFHVLPKLDGCQAKIANYWSCSLPNY
jgi:hypothetical protein